MVIGPGVQRAAQTQPVPTPSATPPPQVLAPESQLLSDQARGQPPGPTRPAMFRPAGGPSPPDYHP
ncbi:hypothetical protein PGT21_002545 [Puccinia graminis f. sp. tritici]|uniref:Uncharacterized protein n=1 Tax=Puccinia graminis f. sp. tritici TaxID=56615 RepID=A0A5B0LSN7_PUCGR|nr:hypothetical protein PGT21_002545 [Puccinia graminis f. sp. tritici]